MDLTTKLDLIKQVGEEILTEGELIELLKTKTHPIAYDGFEPSGKIHIAQGLLRAININKLTKAGIKFKMLVADWHGWANNKMGGDLDKIQVVGKYFVEVWESCGMDLKNVEFVWANDLVADREYWKKVMQVARNNTVQRILRCGEIMGRQEGEVQQASQILYPCMQAADIFQLQADICQLGMDQRKVNVLAREVAPKLGLPKPIIVSHHMLMGLAPPPEQGKDAVERAIAMKMSKSKPESAVFMLDSTEEIQRKINNSYCPPKQVHDNPVLEYCKYILFERFSSLRIERPEKFGGSVEVESYAALSQLYEEGLHPMDLKKAVGAYLDSLLTPVRNHFQKNAKAKKL